MSGMSSIRGMGSLAAVKVAQAKATTPSSQNLTPAATMLEEGSYGLASTAGVGASGVMLFTDAWTGGSGTMLDYYA